MFDATRAPSTIGSWLRAHKWSNVRQLDAFSRELLARLWAAGAGPADLAGPLTIDLDSSIVPVYGRAMQGAAFGYTKVRGYHPQFATCAQTGMVLFSRLRGGSAGAARGAKSFLTETAQHVPSRHLVIADADPALLARAVRQSPAIETLLAHHWMSMVALDQGHGIELMSLLADESDYSLEITEPDHPRWITCGEWGLIRSSPYDARRVRRSGGAVGAGRRLHERSS